MNGSKGYQASDAGEKPDRGEVVFNLQTVQKMLPLVQRIVDDFQSMSTGSGSLGGRR